VPDPDFRRQMIKPVELDSPDGADTWDTLVAASTGDVTTLSRLLARNPRLAQAEYWYTPAIHFAVRDGHADAVRLLLDAGADPECNGLNDRDLIGMARERGREAIAQMLEQARRDCGRVEPQAADHPIHKAAAGGDLAGVRAMLDHDASLVHRGSRDGMAPLHCAVLARSEPMVTLLLDRGANIHARVSRRDLEAIDLAVWGERRHPPHPGIARLLLSRGATHDLAIAAARGDLTTVRQILDADPSRINEARPWGRRPLSTAVEFGHEDIVRLLLERGADPRWSEPGAPHGTALHSASRGGHLTMVNLLLDHGADPNEDVDSTDSPLVFAATEEIRAVIASHGGGRGLFDTEWIEHDETMLRHVAANPSEHAYRIGAAITMTADRPELLARLLGAGIRMPAVHTACQGYLVNAVALRTLLAHGMSPDQMNWQHQTLLHWACTQETSECAAILLDAGASIAARDDEYRSTPLAWAARANRPQVVEFLLSRGAPVDLPDDEPWATPLAWAERRGHEDVAALLRARGGRG
jgi:ankyrin repeat protein